MAIGLVEIVMVLAVAAGTALAVRWTRHAWLTALPLFFLVAAVVSPADPVSMLLVAIPNCLLYATAIRYFRQPAEPHPARD